MSWHQDDIRSLVEAALGEDAPSGDLTASLVLDADARCRAELRAKAKGVLAGSAVAQAVFDVVVEQDGTDLEVQWHREDGTVVRPGEVVAVVSGSAASVLVESRAQTVKATV